jgi:hypothetical protein
MKKYLTLCFFTLIISVSKAQTPNQSSAATVDMPMSNFFPLSDKSAMDKMPVEVGKERYFNSDTAFCRGELITKKRHFTDEMTYRFDQIERAVEVKFESGRQLYLDDKDIVLFKLFIDKNIVVFTPVQLPKQPRKMLVQIIYKTKTLELYRDVHRVVSRRIDNIRTKDYTDKALNNYRYYFRKNENAELVEVEINAKSFKKVLPEKAKEIDRLFEKEEDKGKLTVTKIRQILELLEEKSN